MRIRHRFDAPSSRSCAAAVALAAGLAACAAPPAPAAQPPATTLRLSSGIPGATFHPLGERLADGYRRVLPELTVEIQESPGSVRNVRALQAGTADLGFAFADVTYVAFVGRLADDPRPHDQLRGVAVLQLTPLHLLARAGLDLRSIAELRGRRVGTGPPGSGTALTSDILMRGFGVTPDQVAAEALPFNDAARRLVAGTLDAAFVSAGYPSESVQIATRAGAHLVAVEGDAVTRLRTEYPFLRPTFVPGGTYPGHPASVSTVGVDSLLLCRASLDEDLVYRLTAAFFEVLPTLSTELESLQLMDVARASATPIPLHRGAARYYRERELTR
ncbi:MAG: TAXI family TRAP transporter solute-binding subunit [Vicinamibacterales bacterium]